MRPMDEISRLKDARRSLGNGQSQTTSRKKERGKFKTDGQCQDKKIPREYETRRD